MRTIVLAAFTVIGLGLVGVSAASAVPVNLNVISEAATGDTTFAVTWLTSISWEDEAS